MGLNEKTPRRKDSLTVKKKAKSRLKGLEERALRRRSSLRGECSKEKGIASEEKIPRKVAASM